MKDRLAISAEVWSLRVRNYVALVFQVLGFAAVFLAAFVLFYPWLGSVGAPIGIVPGGTVMEFYGSLGIDWRLLGAAGAVTVWVSTQ
jgi:hypothetical protein